MSLISKSARVLANHNLGCKQRLRQAVNDRLGIEPVVWLQIWRPAHVRWADQVPEPTLPVTNQFEGEGMTWMRQPSWQGIALFSVRMEFWRSTRSWDSKQEDSRGSQLVKRVTRDPWQKRPLPVRGRLVFFCAVSTYSSSASKWKKTPFCSWPITA